MKIIFVYPRFKKFLDNFPIRDRVVLEKIIGSFKTPPSLGIPILKALTPPAHETVLLDDNLGDPVDFSVEADLIAINCFTPQATRAFELADGFRAAGKKVIMGGIFPSTMPEECLEHADAVNIGEAEPVWQQILRDVEDGCLKRRYTGGNRFDLSETPTPDRSIFYENKGYDWHSGLVQVARGCGFTCAMCVIPGYMGQRIRFRPVAHVLDEIAALPYEQIYIADDTLFLTDRRSAEYAVRLLTALKPLKRRLFLSTTMALNAKTEFLKLVKEAGTETLYCTFNVDPLSMRAICYNDPVYVRKFMDFIHAIQDLDINVYASFGIGRDWDDESVADRILDLCLKSGITISEFFIFTPFPGSVQFRRMTSQNRLLHNKWELFNGAHAVYRPLKMTPEKLQEMFWYIWNQFYHSRKKDFLLEKLGKHTCRSPHPDHTVNNIGNDT